MQAAHTLTVPSRLCCGREGWVRCYVLAGVGPDALATGLLAGTPLERRAQWPWNQRPATRREAGFFEWLSEEGQRDDERMALVLVSCLVPDSNFVDVGAANAFAWKRRRPFSRDVPPGTGQVAVLRLPDPPVNRDWTHFAEFC